MKITGISGSPTPGGNNERMLEFALGTAQEQGYDTEKILLSTVKHSGGSSNE